MMRSVTFVGLSILFLPVMIVGGLAYLIFAALVAGWSAGRNLMEWMLA